MTIPASVLVQLATLGLSPEKAEAVANMLSEVEAATKAEEGAALAGRRAADRERKQRQRHVTSRDVTGQTVTSETDPSPASLPEKKVSPDPSKKTNPLSTPIPSSQPSAVRSAPARDRGSRVDGFEPQIATAVEMGLTPERARLQSDKFLDFWRAKPGKDGVKVDWPATWRNWIRGEIERNGAGRPLAANGPPSKPLRQNERLRLKLLGEYDDDPLQPDRSEAIEGDFRRRTGAH